MKTLKKAMALLMTVALMLVMAVPAFAAEEANGTITINNAQTGTTYSAYKLLTLSYEDHGTPTTSDDGYVYYLPENNTEEEDWHDFLTGPDIKNIYIKVGSNNIVTWVDGASAEEFAQLALDYANDKDLEPDGTDLAESSVVVLSAAGPGYYLVDSSVGALVVLTTATPNVTIQEKNDAPTIEKKVLEEAEDGTGSWVDLNRVEAGDEIFYRVIINVKDGAQNYVLYDQMDEDHLSRGDSVIEVYLNDDGSKNSSKKVAAENYTDAVGGDSDAFTFKVEFDNDFLANLGKDDVLTVYYSAVFVGTVDAVTDAPHSNTAWLTYGDDGESVPDTVQTVSYGLEVLKYANGNVSLPLAGAKFELYRTRTGNEGAYLYSDKVYVHAVEVNAAGQQVYTVCNHPERHNGSDENPNATTEMETPESGTFILYGLDLETYYLVETEAPAGYNPLEEGIEVALSINNMTTDRIYDVNVNNNTGSILPDTGGIGTMIFYVMGGLLVVGAVVLLVTKKRMGTDK